MHIVVFVTAASKNEANKLAEALVKKKLVACANVIDKIESVFRWQGKVDKAGEALLVLKSGKRKLPAIIKLVKSMHSYSLPEIIALPVIGGSKAYLEWINESIR